MKLWVWALTCRSKKTSCNCLTSSYAVQKPGCYFYRWYNFAQPIHPLSKLCNNQYFWLLLSIHLISCKFRWVSSMYVTTQNCSCQNHGIQFLDGGLDSKSIECSSLVLFSQIWLSHMLMSSSKGRLCQQQLLEWYDRTTWQINRIVVCRCRLDCLAQVSSPLAHAKWRGFLVAKHLHNEWIKAAEYPTPSNQRSD